jgi:3-phosphoshikimate 1-carboxyvinyltransferase
MIIYPSKLSGKISAPPSKSMANRAVLCAALADGHSTIENIELSNDISAMIDAMRVLGAVINVTGEGRIKSLEVTGADLSKARKRMPTIDCGESGSLLRFIIPVALAATGGANFTGCGRLPERPIDIYEKLFVPRDIKWSHGAKNLPLKASGTLKSSTFEISGNVSSQYITGMLLALPLIDGDSRIIVTGDYESRKYVDMTVEILGDFGIVIECTDYGFKIAGGQKYKPVRYSVEGDWSQAAYLILAGILGNGTQITGLMRGSLQGDSAIVDILQSMGADINWEGDILHANKSSLYATKANVSQCPDLAPAIALAMTCAEGRSTISGGARLRIKESDRIESVANALNGLGADVTPTADGMLIYGKASLTGGAADAVNDHRIAMMTGIASSYCENEIELTDSESVNKSYPSFWEDFVLLGGKIK